MFPKSDQMNKHNFFYLLERLLCCVKNFFKCLIIFRVSNKAIKKNKKKQSVCRGITLECNSDISQVMIYNVTKCWFLNL